MNPICPYCGHESNLVNGLAIYPHRYDLRSLKFFQCAPCDAYVGCHKATGKPLGTLANSYLREARKEAHFYFDAIWSHGTIESRSLAYKWLSDKMQLPSHKTHIAMFSLEQCRQVISHSQQLLSQ